MKYKSLHFTPSQNVKNKPIYKLYFYDENMQLLLNYIVTKGSEPEIRLTTIGEGCGSPRGEIRVEVINNRGGDKQYK